LKRSKREKSYIHSKKNLKQCDILGGVFGLVLAGGTGAGVELLAMFPGFEGGRGSGPFLE
jgi:hypothetical protein